jgi:hypothetical protein
MQIKVENDIIEEPPSSMRQKKAPSQASSRRGNMSSRKKKRTTYSVASNKMHSAIGGSALGDKKENQNP